WENIKSRWKNATREQNAMQQWSSWYVQNAIIIAADNAKFYHDPWNRYGDTDRKVEFLDLYGTLPEGPEDPRLSFQDIQYCYIDLAPNICQFTIRWVPALVSAVTILIKGLAACLALKFLPHFRTTVFNN